MFASRQQPGPQGVPCLGYSKTVTGTAAQFTTSSVPCNGVYVESTEYDDSNAAMTGIMYVQIGGVKIKELRQSEGFFFPCADANEIYIVTQAGTAWARAVVYREVQA